MCTIRKVSYSCVTHWHLTQGAPSAVFRDQQRLFFLCIYQSSATSFLQPIATNRFNWILVQEVGAKGAAPALLLKLCYIVSYSLFLPKSALITPVPPAVHCVLLHT